MSRSKGTTFETAVRRALNGELTDPSMRFLEKVPKGVRAAWTTGVVPDAARTGSRAYELGDIEIPGFGVECKDQKKMALSGWVDQAVEATVRLDRVKPKSAPHIPITIHKRPRRNVLESYVTQPLWAWALVYDRETGDQSTEVERLTREVARLRSELQLAKDALRLIGELQERVHVAEAAS